MINKYQAHSQEICGLRWSPDGYHIASGGNDNKLVVYSHKQQ
jgi:cell division cycle 20-like protein 1 (cofactor of APC complex)